MHTPNTYKIDLEIDLDEKTQQNSAFLPKHLKPIQGISKIYGELILLFMNVRERFI